MSFISTSVSNSIEHMSPSTRSRFDGETFRIPEDLPPLLRRNMEGHALVKSLRIEQKPIRKAHSLINHDYLVVEVDHIRIGPKKVCRSISIMAEKTVNKGGKGVITINKLPDEIDQESQEKWSYELEGCEMIAMKDLVNILVAPSPDYDVMANNCWKYADETYRKLIQTISDLPGTKSDTKERLQIYLESLPPHESPGEHLAFSPVDVAGTFSGSVIFFLEEAARQAAILLPAVVGLGTALPLSPVAWIKMVTVAASSPASWVPPDVSAQVLLHVMQSSHGVGIPVQHMVLAGAHGASSLATFAGPAKVAVMAFHGFLAACNPHVLAVVGGIAIGTLLLIAGWKLCKFFWKDKYGVNWKNLLPKWGRSFLRWIRSFFKTQANDQIVVRDSTVEQEMLI